MLMLPECWAEPSITTNRQVLECMLYTAWPAKTFQQIMRLDTCNLAGCKWLCTFVASVFSWNEIIIS